MKVQRQLVYVFDLVSFNPILFILSPATLFTTFFSIINEFQLLAIVTAITSGILIMLLLSGLFMQLVWWFTGGGVLQRGSGADIVEWLSKHSGTGHRFRLRDICSYSGDQEDKLTFSNEPPPKRVSPHEALTIVGELHRAGLLNMNIAKGNVEWMEVDLSGGGKALLRYRRFKPDDLVMDPVRLIISQVSWFLLTLMSSTISVYSREILKALNVIE